MSLPEAKKEVTNMEDSGHGQDIGSDTLLGDSRVMDTSEEEEERGAPRPWSAQSQEEDSQERPVPGANCLSFKSP